MRKVAEKGGDCGLIVHIAREKMKKWVKCLVMWNIMPIFAVVFSSGELRIE